MIPKIYQQALHSLSEDKIALQKAMELYIKKGGWDDEVQTLVEKAFPGTYQETEWSGPSRAWKVEDQGFVLILHRGAQAGRRNPQTKTRFFTIQKIT